MSSSPYERTAFRRLLRRAILALSICWLLYLLVLLSSTGLDFPSFLLSFAVTLVFAAASLALVFTRRPFAPWGIVAWLVFPLAASSLVLLFLFSQSPANPLFRLRFHLSRSALDTAAQIALPQKPSATPAWVGLFPVRRVDVRQAEARFISDGCGVIDECGLVYLPGPPPQGRSKTRIKHLDGPWYHLYSVF